jgi:ketosteroid isomerase-like protein
MKTTISKFVLLSLIVLFLSSNLYVSEPPTTLKATIESLNAKINKMWINQDFGKMLYYCTDDVIIMQNYTPMIKGKKAFGAFMMEMKESRGYSMASNEMKTLEVSGSGDQIVEIGKYKASFKVARLAELQCDEGAYVTVWQKMADGSLKMKAAIWNSGFSPMEKREVSTKSRIKR